MKPLQKRYQYFQYLQNRIREGNFPIGTIAYYGPDDQTITKVVAGVLPDENTNPVLQKWVGEGVALNSETVAAIGKFFLEHQTQNIVMTEGVIGCPHEEGIDYPDGEACTECPFWAKE